MTPLQTGPALPETPVQRMTRTNAATGREGLSDEEKIELAQDIAEAVDLALNPPAEEGEDEPESPSDGDEDDFEVATVSIPDPSGDSGKHPNNVYLDALTRDQLNALASEKGIEHPEKLPNKAAVIDAIVDATPPAGEGE